MERVFKNWRRGNHNSIFSVIKDKNLHVSIFPKTLLKTMHREKVCTDRKDG